MISKNIMNVFFNLMIGILLSLDIALVQANQLIQGNAPASTNTSFTVPISVLKRSDNFNFYVGASATGAEGFSIARYIPGSQATPTFLSMTPQNLASFNGAASNASPLYNSAISLLAPMAQTRLAAVASSSPASLYLLNNLEGTYLLSLATVMDGGSAPTGGILDIIAPDVNNLFAAVIASGQTQFGIGNSGIALCKVLDTPKEDKTIIQTLVQLDLQGNTAVPPTNPNAAILNTSTPAVFIEAAAASIGTNFVDMHWSPELQRLYVAYDAVGGSGSNNGVRSVVVGYIVGSTMYFVPIAPDGVFVADNQNEIIGAIAANAIVIAQKVLTMQTSTQLNYLIVLGENLRVGGDLGLDIISSVYALPLVNTATSNGVSANNQAIQGTLADVTVPPVVTFVPTTSNPVINLFSSRQFQTPATTNAGIYTNSSVPAQVGGGSLPAGPINTMIVSGDAVFVSVGSPSTGQYGGIFYSQAIFDASGVIVGWTQWLPACGFLNSVFTMGYLSFLDSFIVGTGSSSSTVNAFFTTEWGLGNSPGLGNLVGFANSFFNKPSGGLQFLQSFYPGYPGVLDIGLLAGVGLNKVLLAQTGATIAGTFTPSGSGYSANAINFTSGAITQSIPSTTQVITFSGGALAGLGPLQALEIGTTGSAAWLFVGGVNGLAVLANAGAGWDPSTGLSTGFSGLTSGMTFTTIGSYSFVRKLMSDSNFLYVLTDTTFDRIDLTASNFATGSLVVTTLATGHNAPSLVTTNVIPSLIDMVVSQKFVLLATSTGLITGGAGTDVSSASSANAMNWAVVAIPDGIIPPSGLIAVTTSGRPQDVSVGIGGEIYVLNSYSGSDRAHLNRYYVSDTSTNPVTTTTIAPMQDLSAQNTLAAFENYGFSKAMIATDGASYLSGRNRSSLAISPVGGAGFLRTFMPFPLTIESYNQITSILRNSSSGSWIFAGDFGLRVNE